MVSFIRADGVDERLTGATEKLVASDHSLQEVQRHIALISGDSKAREALDAMQVRLVQQSLYPTTCMLAEAGLSRQDLGLVFTVLKCNYKAKQDLPSTCLEHGWQAHAYMQKSQGSMTCCCFCNFDLSSQYMRILLGSETLP